MCLVKTECHLSLIDFFFFFCLLIPQPSLPYLIPWPSLPRSFYFILSASITTIMFEMSNHTPTTSSIELTFEAPLNQTIGELQNLQAAYRLTEKSYLQWSQLVWTFLKSRGKLSHLLGTGPKSKDPKFQSWNEEDSKIMSWIRNSMTIEISGACMFFTTAREIWESIQQTYSKVWDFAQIFESKVKL